MNIPTVVFDNPDATWKKKSRAKKNSPSNKRKTVSEVGIEIDLKKARFEIMKMSAKETKDVDAETAIAISLGAKPEKRKAINYKELKSERMEKKAKELVDAEQTKKIKLPVKKPTKKTKKSSTKMKSTTKKASQ